jgi:aldehyde dehydrogenase (NAD+)
METNRIQSVYLKQKVNKSNVAFTSAKERVLKLKRLRRGILNHRHEIAAAIKEDFGKQPVETDITEIIPVLSEIRHTIRHLSRWMKPKKVGTPLLLFGTRSYIRYEPKGIVLIISPWNYPFTLTFNPLIAAIAAGNCAMIKTSEKVPKTSGFIARFIGSLFPEEEVAVLNGNEVDNSLLFDVPYDHIFFTGSTRVGKLIMAEAAKQLIPVTLELSGKSPAIVDESADCKKAVERILFGKIINAGQTCVAPDYALVHRTQYDNFISQSRAFIKERYHIASDKPHCEDLTRLVSHDHWDKLQSMLENSKKQGAEIVIDGPNDRESRYMYPTVITSVKPDSCLMAEEIFGPILPVITFDTTEEALEIIRYNDKPLAIYIFSRDKKNIASILNGFQSGGVCLNATVAHLVNANLPFGGIGYSGTGYYHGSHGFETLSHKRAVLRQGPLDIIRIFYAPYTLKVKRIVNTIVKHI